MGNERPDAAMVGHSQSALERFREERRARKRSQKLPADFRAPNEDDDGYDPYSDYMDALARRAYDEPEEDPWR